MIENWKDIEGYEGRYQISNYGRVRSLPRKVRFGNQTRLVGGKILKHKVKRGGYAFIQLRIDLKERDFHIHRLVAKSFVKGYQEGLDVNHIDGNKLNNKATNLEWCTRKQNIFHSIYILKQSRRCKAVQSHDDNGRIHRYVSITDASRQTGISHKRIANCLKQENSTVGGLKWNYI